MNHIPFQLVPEVKDVLSRETDRILSELDSPIVTDGSHTYIRHNAIELVPANGKAEVRMYWRNRLVMTSVAHIDVDGSPVLIDGFEARQMAVNEHDPLMRSRSETPDVVRYKNQPLVKSGDKAFARFNEIVIGREGDSLLVAFKWHGENNHLKVIKGASIRFAGTIALARMDGLVTV